MLASVSHGERRWHMFQPAISIIAFDPGEITGYCFFARSRDSTEKDMFQWYEKPWLDAVHHIATYARNMQRIVGERFDQPGKRGSVLTAQPAALMCIGAVQYVATQCNVTFELQGRSDASKITDKVLKQLGWYVKTQDDHANAAARQLAYAMLVHHPVEYIAMLESS